MTPEKIEGTLVLDGLIEGRTSRLADAAGELRRWTASARLMGLTFNLQTDGASFSMLPDNAPVAAARLGEDPAARIAELLDELVRIFPASERREILSTLRSAHYLPGREVQTLYAVGPDGAAQTQQRTVDAATTRPPEKLTARAKARLALTALAIVVALAGLSAIFVDYPALWGRLRSRMMPFHADSIRVEIGHFAPFFRAENRQMLHGGTALGVTLRRQAAFPRTDDDCRKLLDEANSLPARLTADALARGYVRCELFDEEEEFLGYSMHRIADLRRKDTLQIAIAIPRERRLARVSITY